MPNDTSWLEILIIAFILGGIGFVMWRGGAANPVGTGRLQHMVKNARQEVIAIDHRLKGLESTSASKADLDRIRDLMNEEHVRINRLFDQIGGIDERQDKIAELLATTAAQTGTIARQVDRLYDVIVPKGMGS